MGGWWICKCNWYYFLNIPHSIRHTRARAQTHTHTHTRGHPSVARSLARSPAAGGCACFIHSKYLLPPIPSCLPTTSSSSFPSVRQLQRVTAAPQVKIINRPRRPIARFRRITGERAILVGGPWRIYRVSIICELSFLPDNVLPFNSELYSLP